MLPLADATDIHADTFDLPPEAMRKGSMMSHPKETPMRNIILATAAAVILSAPLAFAANSTATLAPAPKPLKMAAASSLSASSAPRSARSSTRREATHKTNKNYKEALGMRSEGKSLCTAHKEADGVKKIESGAHLDRREADGEGLSFQQSGGRASRVKM